MVEVRDLDDAVGRVLAPIAHGLSVVIGASGGPDSAGLLLLVARARPDLHALAVHVRHGLRDDVSDRDAAELQARLAGAEFIETTVTVARDGEGLEAAARVARHRALQSVASRSRLPAAGVLLGHTADDQAETVMLRLARGTTLHGAGGMASWRDEVGGVPVVRPMLGLRRDDVHKFVVRLEVPFVQDPTNQDPAFARNVVRSEVLPALGRQAGDPAGALARFADRAREDEAVLRGLALDLVAGSAELGSIDGAPVWSIAPAAVFDAAPALGRRVIAELLTRVRPEVGVVTDEIDDVLSLAVDRQVDRRGVIVTRHGRSLTFRRA